MHVTGPSTQHSLPVHVIPLPEQLEYVPPTQTLPVPPLDDPPLDEPPLDELVVVSPQNAFFDRAHATSDPAHKPSTHAAARYEVPLEQSQHVGLQSANVEQLAPADFVPRSSSGRDGQAPFVCSA